MTGYTYPDSSESVTTALIGSGDESTNYWLQSEQLALRLAEHAMATRRTPLEFGLALDLGTGEGRLLPWLLGFSASVVAADPDPSRLAKAASRFASDADVPGNERLRFVSDASQAVTPGTASAILCSHVLQHVSSDTQTELVEMVSALASDHAFLVLLFTHGDGSGAYTIDRVVDGDYHVTEVDEATFLHYAAGKASEETDVLPVRRVVVDVLGDELRKYGWSELLRWQHHVSQTDYSPTVMDDLAANVNHADPDRIPGRDLLMVFAREAR